MLYYNKINKILYGIREPLEIFESYNLHQQLIKVISINNLQMLKIIEGKYFYLNSKLVFSVSIPGKKNLKKKDNFSRISMESQPVD